MKNAKLNILELGHALSRSEMRKLKAGSGSGNCFTCYNGKCISYFGTCCTGWTQCDSNGSFCLLSGAGCGA